MSESRITPEIIETILRTSRVKNCKDVYSLAPRGSRVGIYFQQRRATLLAAAIGSRLGRGVLEECNIGIVGGGVSGMTFLLAITREGARRVRLYEATNDIITTGKSAKHRLLHPNYNRWPLLGSMDVFTSLPMLNWHATSADRVTALMKKEIETHHYTLMGNAVRYNHKVTKVVQRGAGPRNPLLVEFTQSGVTHKAEHKIVVIAAGFGRESASTWGLDDYWSDRHDFDEGLHTRPCTVYGAGDGALIDIIRSCARKPSEAWQLPLEMIARNRSETALTFQNDRPDRYVPLRRPEFTEFEKKIQAHEESIRCVAWPMSRDDVATSDAYAVDEEKFYMGCIADLRDRTPDLHNNIDKLLKPIASRSELRPTLIGTRVNGFEPTSAPINKLLLAYLLESGRIAYERRAKVQTELELAAWSKASAPDRVKRIIVCRFGATKNFPPARDPASRPADHIIVEVEGDGPVVETDVEADLIDALSGVTGGGFVYFDEMPDPLIVARYGDDKVGANRNTLENNKALLVSFANEHLNNATVERVNQFGKDESKWMLGTNLNPAQILERLVRIGGVDGHFLGAPIVVSSNYTDVRQC